MLGRTRFVMNCCRTIVVLVVCFGVVVETGCRQMGSRRSSSKSAASTSSSGGAAVERDQVQLDVRIAGADARQSGDTLTLDYPVLKEKNDIIPDWVINPGLDGVTGALGVAARRGLGTKEQLDEARLNARIEIASMLEARVQRVGRLELEQNVSSTGVENRSERARKDDLGIDRNILDMVLAGSRQRALWFDPENSECFVWMVLDGNVLQAADHYTVDSVSVFVASKPITTPYRPQRRKQPPPQITIEIPATPAAPPPLPTPEAEKTPAEKLEESLKEIQTIPLKDADKSGE